MKDDVAALLKTGPRRTSPDDLRLRGLDDVYGWAKQQAEHIRSRRFDLLDHAALADEIEDVARREYEALISDIVVVLAHMLKWDQQTSHRSRSWQQSIGEHRDRVLDRLADSPSLKPRLSEALDRAYRYARKQASRETALPLRSFPASCPYEWNDVMTRDFVLADD